LYFSSDVKEETTMKIGNISSKQLLNTKNGNIALFLVGVYFCLVSLVLTGAIDYPNIILGLTFIAVAVIRSRAQPLVLSGLFTGFLGVVTVLSIGNVLSIDTAWMLAAVFAGAILLFELGGLKFGKSSARAKIAIIIPMTSLFLMFALALIGLNPAIYVDWATNTLKFVNYLALLFLTGLITFELLGWKLAKKNQGMYIIVLGLVCMATAFMAGYASLAWY